MIRTRDENDLFTNDLVAGIVQVQLVNFYASGNASLKPPVIMYFYAEFHSITRVKICWRFLGLINAIADVM